MGVETGVDVSVGAVCKFDGVWLTVEFICAGNGFIVGTGIGICDVKVSLEDEGIVTSVFKLLFEVVFGSVIFGCSAEIFFSSRTGREAEDLSYTFCSVLI